MENVQRLSRKRVHQKRMLMETGKSSNMKLKFTKEELEKLYIEEELSTRDIAKQLNIFRSADAKASLWLATLTFARQIGASPIRLRLTGAARQSCPL